VFGPRGPYRRRRAASQSETAGTVRRGLLAALRPAAPYSPRDRLPGGPIRSSRRAQRGVGRRPGWVWATARRPRRPAAMTAQLVFVLALHFVQHLPPSLPFSVLALSLLRISIIPDPTGSPWMPMTVRGCVPLCMYLDNEKCVYGILLRRISCFRVDRHG